MNSHKQLARPRLLGEGPGAAPVTTPARRAVVIAANYATQSYVTTLSGAPIYVMAGERKDSVTDATLIATWSANWTTTAPVAGVGNVTGVMAGYLATYPSGPQVS